MRVTLRVPPIPCIVHESVFDAFGWHASDTLEWVSQGGVGSRAAPTSENPPGLGFVLRPPEVPFLPSELASLHLPAVPLPEGARVLAPWGIDAATDGLFEHRTPPREALYLATTSLAALFWGLHDWAHFHAHGPFERVAETELQCDATALVWLALNREALGLDREALAGVRRAALGLARARFASEGRELDEGVLSEEALEALGRAGVSAPGGAR